MRPIFTDTGVEGRREFLAKAAKDAYRAEQERLKQEAAERAAEKAAREQQRYALAKQRNLESPRLAQLFWESTPAARTQVALDYARHRGWVHWDALGFPDQATWDKVFKELTDINTMPVDFRPRFREIRQQLGV
jgi:hypothetical protein